MSKRDRCKIEGCKFDAWYHITGLCYKHERERRDLYGKRNKQTSPLKSKVIPESEKTRVQD